LKNNFKDEGNVASEKEVWVFWNKMLRKIDSSEAIYVTEKERKYNFFTLRKGFQN